MMRLLLSLCIAASLAGAADAQDLTVFVARKVVTMNPSQPTATAVAVRDDRIVSVGSLESLAPWLRSHDYVTDRTFANHVIVPGLIDNHLHPSLAAIVTPMHWLTPHPWKLATGNVDAVPSQEAFLSRLRDLDAALAPGEWLFTWGYHQLFHGAIGREELDAISATRPIVAWHRSFHEIYLSSAALEELGLSADQFADHPAIDFERGRFFETGLGAAVAALAPHIRTPEKMLHGLELTRTLIRAGGITTIADLNFAGLGGGAAEWQLFRQAWDNDQTPFRTLLVPGARGFAPGSESEAVAQVEEMAAMQTDRIRVLPKTVKLFADGAFYSQLMKMGPPGYIDGHHGEWLMEPTHLEAAARAFWQAGYQVHVHANGDVGIGATLDVLQTLLEESPRPDHRFALHHYGYSTQAQARRVAALGAVVSAQPFYLWALADSYAEQGLGADRAGQMSRLGSLVREGVAVSLHSDFTMAPASPLTLASVAVTRKSASGKVWAPEERLTREQGLRAVTIDAAHAIGMEGEIGSIEAGKKADFTVLAVDPLEVDADTWPDIEIVATVFEGTVFPRE